MPTAVDSTFDVAFWFADTALEQNEYLQPQKLHRLLYLAQAYYAAAFNGAKLMPATFVADGMGPLEPNVYRAFAKGRPDVEADLFLDPEVEMFLDGIWRRFGHHSAERLTRMVKKTVAFKQALKRGDRAEIGFESMLLSFARAEETPAVNQVIRPKMVLTHTGKSVPVRAWVPAAAPKGAKRVPATPAAPEPAAAESGSTTGGAADKKLRAESLQADMSTRRDIIRSLQARRARKI